MPDKSPLVLAWKIAVSMIADFVQRISSTFYVFRHKSNGCFCQHSVHIHENSLLPQVQIWLARTDQTSCLFGQKLTWIGKNVPETEYQLSMRMSSIIWALLAAYLASQDCKIREKIHFVQKTIFFFITSSFLHRQFPFAGRWWYQQYCAMSSLRMILQFPLCKHV